MRRRPTFWLRLALAPLVVWAVYLLKANVWFRLYPVIMTLIVFIAFAGSLFRTPIVVGFAAMMGETLDEKGLAYCRRVTVVWTVFLAFNLAVAIASVFASAEFWALWNGCLSYVLMGLLFAGEYLVRRRVRRG